MIILYFFYYYLLKTPDHFDKVTIADSICLSHMCVHMYTFNTQHMFETKHWFIFLHMFILIVECCVSEHLELLSFPPPLCVLPAQACY